MADAYGKKLLMLEKNVKIKPSIIRQFLAEFLGTLVLVAFGDGSLAQHRLSRQSHGTFHSVAFSWGLGITMGIYVCGGVSGGHINPAVSLAMAVVGKLEFWRVPVFWVAQYLGAFVASACIFGVYRNALDNFDGGNRTITGPTGTAGIWASYPQPFLSIGNGLGDQVFATALILVCILAITDKRNMKTPSGLVPIAIGFIFFAIGMSYGYNCGFPVNPARDLAPRVFTAIAGWGRGVFTASNNWSWVPIAGPHIGAIAGAIVYQCFVGYHWPQEDEYEIAIVQAKELGNGKDNPGYSMDEMGSS